MQANPLVTVGILSYNRPKDLREAISSVINQTYRNIEIIISDNGSTNPEPAQVIKEYAGVDNRIRFFLHEKNQGPLFNFEFLTTQAKGEYFIWLADDDYFLPNYIEDCVIAFREKGANVVLAASIPVYANDKKPVAIQFFPDTVNLSQTEKYKKVIRHVFTDMNLFYYGLIDTDALRKCTYYKKKVFGSDILLLFELLNFGDIYINKKKYGFAYRMHVNQTSGSPLSYKKISCVNGTFIERRLFFSAYILFMIRIVIKNRKLTLSEKLSVIGMIISFFISSKRYHLIKYDLGINNLIQKLKSVNKKRKVS